MDVVILDRAKLVRSGHPECSIACSVTNKDLIGRYKSPVKRAPSFVRHIHVVVMVVIRGGRAPNTNRFTIHDRHHSVVLELALDVKGVPIRVVTPVVYLPRGMIVLDVREKPVVWCESKRGKTLEFRELPLKNNRWIDLDLGVRLEKITRNTGCHCCVGMTMGDGGFGVIGFKLHPGKSQGNG